MMPDEHRRDFYENMATLIREAGSTIVRSGIHALDSNVPDEIAMLLKLVGSLIEQCAEVERHIAWLRKRMGN